MEKDVRHIFLIGAKNLGLYGGYETFVNKLTEYHEQDTRFKYHVACKATGTGAMDINTLPGVSDITEDKKGRIKEFTYHNARCFTVGVPDIGAAQAVWYDVMALKKSCRYIKKNKIQQPVIYIMACRIGPFASYFYHKIRKLGGQLYLNPDGHEWMRAKWSFPVRKYWMLSERSMVKHCDLVICDSVNIENYIRQKYRCRTTYIAYGAETELGTVSGTGRKLEQWYRTNGLKPKEYYLAVSRFVPENNFEIMIREFMRSKTEKKFAIITTENEKFMDELEKKLHFSRDERIKFAGTVYDADLLREIRLNAYGYFHGHEVGGTNPSLLEAMSSTNLNLLLNVDFNREVAGDTALYWTKEHGSLSSLIDNADKMTATQVVRFGTLARARVKRSFSWGYICRKYAEVFVDGREKYT
jgi:rhamnosyltransferase